MTAPKQQLLKEISNASARGYSYYVYTLADSSGVFYIGKGTKDRLFHHQRLPECDRNFLKKARIKGAGTRLNHVVVAYFKDEPSAYGHESELIHSSPGLTNILNGEYVAPIERARQRTQSILDALPPLEQMHSDIRFFWPGPGKATPRQAYDRLVEEIKKEIKNPSPTSMSFDRSGKLVSVGYNSQSAEVSPPEWLTAGVI